MKWCDRTRRTHGATVAIDVVFELSRPWYRDRLDPKRTNPSTDRRQSWLTDVGLSGAFWALSG